MPSAPSTRPAGWRRRCNRNVRRASRIAGGHRAAAVCPAAVRAGMLIAARHGPKHRSFVVDDAALLRVRLSVGWRPPVPLPGSAAAQSHLLRRRRCHRCRACNATHRACGNTRRALPACRSAGRMGSSTPPIQPGLCDRHLPCANFFDPPDPAGSFGSDVSSPKTGRPVTGRLPMTPSLAHGCVHFGCPCGSAHTEQGVL